jgi:hypothetical protein
MDGVVGENEDVDTAGVANGQATAEEEEVDSFGFTKGHEENFCVYLEALEIKALRKSKIDAFVAAREAELKTLTSDKKKGRPSKEVASRKAALNRAIHLARHENILPTDQQQERQEESEEEKAKRAQKEKDTLTESATGAHVRHHIGPGEAKRGCSEGTSKASKDPMSIGHHKRPMSAAQLKYVKEVRQKAMSQTEVRRRANILS